jgi:hypothetical protein
VSDTGLVLLTAGLLSASSVGLFAWRVGVTDPSAPERLIGELRLSQVAAVLLAAMGAISVGLAIAGSALPASHIDAALGVGFLILATFVLQREPREALLLAAAGFVLHALVTLAHRPGLLPADLAPRWFAIGSATYDVVLAALCYWARRR